MRRRVYNLPITFVLHNLWLIIYFFAFFLWPFLTLKTIIKPSFFHLFLKLMIVFPFILLFNWTKGSEGRGSNLRHPILLKTRKLRTYITNNKIICDKASITINSIPTSITFLSLRRHVRMISIGSLSLLCWWLGRRG